MLLPYFIKMQFPDGYQHDLKPRWGWNGKPAHQRLTELLSADLETYCQRVRSWQKHVPHLVAIPYEQDPHAPGTPHWNNGFFSGLDIVALWGFLASERPATYLEIGSGNSTKIAAVVRKIEGLPTRIVSIDPAPRAEIDALCDELIREPLEVVETHQFASLKAGDMVFFDGSHRALQNSDVTVFFTEILPELPPGVLVHIHDVILPQDYPAMWSDRMYNEQYMLALLLLFAADKFKVEFPASFVSWRPDVVPLLNELWEKLPMIERHGSSFWFRRTS